MADDPANALAERGPRDRVIVSAALTHAAMRMSHYRVAAGLVATLLLLDTAGGLAGEKIQVKWNGNYPHNNERTFSESYQLGWSKNFMNGFPEENGVVQRDGFLPAELFKPNGSGPFPFVVLMHGCGGMDASERSPSTRSRLERSRTYVGPRRAIGPVGVPRMPTPPSNSWPRPATPT